MLGKAKDSIIAAALTVLSFFIYRSTMSRSMPYIDGGEITTVLWTLGIAHPTGYPLFTLLGCAFVHIPFFNEVVERANLFAVVCTSIAGGVFYFVFMKAQLVLAGGQKENAPVKKNKKNRRSTSFHNAQSGNPEGHHDRFQKKPLGNDKGLLGNSQRLASIAATLSLIFSKTFWTQGTVIESYPLQLLIFALIFLSWLKFYSSPNRSTAFVAGLTLGLGFTNHMTTVLAVPALVFLLISWYRQHHGEIRSYASTFGFIILGGALAGLLYLYLPIRASQHPIMDWGNPNNLQRFIRHVTAKQFRTWMFSSFDVFQHQLGIFYSGLYAEFRITILMVMIGTIASVVAYKKYFWWTTILLLSDLLYAANYSIHNINSYFLLGYISLSLFAAIGFRFTLERFAIIFRRKAVTTGVLLVFPAVSALANYNMVDASNDYAVESYTHDILTSLPQNSLVLSYQWDTFVAASLYYRNVDRLRPDVIVIDKELLRRSWYASQVHSRYPFIFPNDNPIYQEYQDNLRLFENNLPYDPNVIERSYSNFIREIILGAMKDGRDVFAGPEIEDQYLHGFSKVPYSLLFELRTDTNYISFTETRLDGYRAARKVNNDYSHQILNFYSRMFQARAAYEYSHHKLEQTSLWLDKALNIDPTSQMLQAAKLQVMREMSRVRQDQNVVPSVKGR